MMITVPRRRKTLTPMMHEYRPLRKRRPAFGRVAAIALIVAMIALALGRLV
jgi:hypothetical protein